MQVRPPMSARKEWSWRFHFQAGLAGPHWDLARRTHLPVFPSLLPQIVHMSAMSAVPFGRAPAPEGARWAVRYAQVVQALPAIAWAVPHEAEKVILS